MYTITGVTFLNFDSETYIFSLNYIKEMQVHGVSRFALLKFMILLVHLNGINVCISIL